MKIEAKSVEEYINQLPDDKKEPFAKLRQVILENLPKGFEEKIQYDMISYVVPKEKYPKGYHCNPEDELAFISLGVQKKHIAIYHMGIYMMPELNDWFVEEYPKYMSTKLNMGKSCIRYTNVKKIPYELIGQLCQKVSVEDHVTTYENILNKDHS